MGSAAKVVLVGAASLIIGIYSVALKRVQTNDLTTSLSQASMVQSEKAGDMALRASLYRVQYNRDLDSVSAYTVTATKTMLGGGTYTYNFPCNAGQMTAIWGTVTVNPSYPPNADPKIIDVRIDKVGNTGSLIPYTKPGASRYVRGRWQITQVFVRPIH